MNRKWRGNLQFPLGAFVGAFLTSCGYEWLLKSTLPHNIPASSSDSTVITVAETLPQPLPPGLGERHLELSRYGLPETHLVRYKSNYISAANLLTRSPAWTLEHLTQSNVQGPVERTGVSFLVDRDLEPQFRAHNEDYFKSGYSRGHMVPAGNSRQSMEAMRDSFLLNSNIVPQDLDNNVFYWNRLERFARQLTDSFDEVYVVTGPLYLSADSTALDGGLTVQDVTLIDANTSTSTSTSAVNARNDDSTIINSTTTYTTASNNNTSSNSNNNMIKKDKSSPPSMRQIRLIGQSEIAVPSHLFKAFLATRNFTPATPKGSDETSDDKRNTDAVKSFYFTAFVVPNRPIDGETPVESFKVDWPTLERLSGIRLFPNLQSTHNQDDYSDDDRDKKQDRASSISISSSSGSNDNNDNNSTIVNNDGHDKVLAMDTANVKNLRLLTRFKHVHDLCAAIGGCYLMDAQRHRLEQLTRNIRSARVKWYADRAMSEIRRTVGASLSGADDEQLVETEILNAYRSKISELNEQAAAAAAASDIANTAAKDESKLINK